MRKAHLFQVAQPERSEWGLKIPFKTAPFYDWQVVMVLSGSFTSALGQDLSSSPQEPLLGVLGLPLSMVAGFHM